MPCLYLTHSHGLTAVALATALHHFINNWQPVKSIARELSSLFPDLLEQAESCSGNYPESSLSSAFELLARVNPQLTAELQKEKNLLLSSLTPAQAVREIIALAYFLRAGQLLNTNVFWQLHYEPLTLSPRQAVAMAAHLSQIAVHIIPPREPEITPTVTLPALLCLKCWPARPEPVSGIISNTFNGRDNATGSQVFLMVLAENHDLPADNDPEIINASCLAPVAVCETVIDDMNPQILPYVQQLLLTGGALDCYFTSIHMKKGRLGTLLTVLCPPEKLKTIADLILKETTTLGLRWRIEKRIILPRQWLEVSTPYGPVRVKVASDHRGKIFKYHPEYEDCRRLAEAAGVPLRSVFQAAYAAAARHLKEH